MNRIYRADGTSEAITPENGKSFSLEECQKVVGGWIEKVTVFTGGKWHYMIINEEGRLAGLPYNAEATRMAGYSIRGDALVCERKMFL